MTTKDLDFNGKIMNFASFDLKTETSDSAYLSALDLKVDGRDDPINLSLSAIKSENLDDPAFLDKFFTPVSSMLPLSTRRSSAPPLLHTTSTSSTAPPLPTTSTSPTASPLPTTSTSSTGPPLPTTSTSSTGPPLPTTSTSSTGSSQETPLICKQETDGSTNLPAAKKKQINLQRPKDFVVLNLGPDLTKQELLTYFKQFGPVQSIQIQKYPDGTSKEYALVRFKSTESTLKVLGRTHQIGSRRCSVRFPNPVYAQTQYVLSVQGNIARLTFEDLWVYFATYGPLFDIYIPDPNNGVCYLITTRENTATDLSGKYHTIKGVSVHVKFRNAMFINGREDMGAQKNHQQTNFNFSDQIDRWDRFPIFFLDGNRFLY